MSRRRNNRRVWGLRSAPQLLHSQKNWQASVGTVCVASAPIQYLTGGRPEWPTSHRSSLPHQKYDDSHDDHEKEQWPKAEKRHTPSSAPPPSHHCALLRPLFSRHVLDDRRPLCKCASTLRLRQGRGRFSGVGRSRLSRVKVGTP